MQKKLEFEEEEEKEISRVSGREKEFSEVAREVGRKCLEFENPLVVGHYDADGLSSTACISIALTHNKRKHSLLTLKKIDERELEKVRKEKEERKANSIIFVDLASSAMKRIEEMFGCKVAIIDHHPPELKEGETKLIVANPHYLGFDGATALCSASCAYYCFRDFVSGDSLRNLCELGIVGAVGDMQDQGGLSELNREMLKHAEEIGAVRIEKDLRIFGRVSRSLVNFLNYCTEPFLPGLTGNDKNCALFLEKNSIPYRSEEGWVHYVDLNNEQKKEFASALINYCYEKGVEEEAIQAMVGEVYSFPKQVPKTELSDAYEYSTLLNACGRHGQEGDGIQTCLGEKDAYARAKSALTIHRKMIRDGILYAKNHVVDVGEYYFLDAKGKIPDTVIGTVAGAYFGSGLVERNKPIIGFSLDEEGNTKVSGRGSKDLVKRGLNLGVLMKEASAGFGNGGGHNLAAGCSFPKNPESEKTFLLKAKEILRKQLKISE